MDFLCSNISQINDNILTVENYVARTTTVSDMPVFPRYLSGYERVYN